MTPPAIPSTGDPGLDRAIDTLLQPHTNAVQREYLREHVREQLRGKPSRLNRSRR